MIKEFLTGEYSPVRSACLLVDLARAGMVPEYGKLTSLTDEQQRLFLTEIAQHQLNMGKLLFANTDNNWYGKKLVIEADQLINKATEVASPGDIEK